MRVAVDSFCPDEDVSFASLAVASWVKRSVRQRRWEKGIVIEFP